MVAHFMDSSALVKHYIFEPGSAWVYSMIDALAEDGQPRHYIFCAQIGLVEVTAAIAKRHRMREISKRVKDLSIGRFAEDYRERYWVIRVDDVLLGEAADLVQRYPLRAYDAVQLGSALVISRQLCTAGLPVLVFVSADGQLCDAAEAEGLKAENPNDHATEEEIRGIC